MPVLARANLFLRLVTIKRRLKADLAARVSSGGASLISVSLSGVRSPLAFLLVEGEDTSERIEAKIGDVFSQSRTSSFSSESLDRVPLCRRFPALPVRFLCSSSESCAISCSRVFIQVLFSTVLACDDQAIEGDGRCESF